MYYYYSTEVGNVNTRNLKVPHVDGVWEVHPLQEVHTQTDLLLDNTTIVAKNPRRDILTVVSLAVTGERIEEVVTAKRSLALGCCLSATTPRAII